MSSKNTVVVIIVLAIVLLGGVYLIRKANRSQTAPTTAPVATVSPSPSSSETASPSAAIQQTVVNITSTGFSPSAVTIKAGESVTWINTDTANHTVNSAPHPTHTAYPPLNLGLIQPGEKKSLTFPTAGVFKYHDHLNPQFTGSVTVQ